MFYGHTHKPWEEKTGQATVLNPGTLAGMWYKATLALIDLASGKATLKLVNGWKNEKPRAGSTGN